MDGTPRRKLRARLLFNDLAAPDELQEILAHARTELYAPGQIIFHEGDGSDDMYVICEGCVEFSLGANRVYLDEQREGEYFGELGIFDDHPRSATAIAREPTTCRVIPQDRLMSWLKAHPDVAVALLRHASRRIRDLSSELGSSLKTAYTRISNYLQHMAVRDGDVRVIHHMPSKKHLARQLHISREHTTNILKDLVGGGFICLDGRRLSLLKELPPTY